MLKIFNSVRSPYKTKATQFGFRGLSMAMLTIKAMNSLTASSGNHTSYIKNDGNLWTTGKNTDGQLGVGHNLDIDTPTIVSLGNFAVSLGSGGGVSLGGSIHFGIAKVAIGNEHTIYVREQNGTHYAFSSGRNNVGQLGLGHQYSQSWISNLSFSESVRQVAAGYDFSLFLTRSGALYGTGANDSGQLGLGHENNVTTLQLARRQGVRQVAAGFYHSLYVMKNGSLWGMGRNFFGQLGLGDRLDRNSSHLILPSGVKQVTVSKRHSLIVKKDGSLWAMGSGTNGQLGSGDSNDSLIPILIESSGVKQASAGLNHSVYVKWDGSLWGMGYDNCGQLGRASPIIIFSPIQIVSSGVEQVSAGLNHTHFLKSDGTLWAMGKNDHGQLGTGDKFDKTTALQIDSNVMRLANTPDPKPEGHKVTALNGEVGDYFGYSVTQSGNTLVVGSRGASPSGLSNAGEVYVYSIRRDGTSIYRDKLIAPDASVGDCFGNSLSLSDNILSVGASESSTNGIYRAGSAYLYQIESNGSANYLAKVSAPDANNSDYFGHSVSITNNILAVGAHQADPDGIGGAGATYLYGIEANGSVSFLNKITAHDKVAADHFGWSLSQSGNLLAVGAHYADPNGLSRAGVVYLYHLDSNGTVTFKSKITAPDKSSNDAFGYSLSFSGKILAVGANWESQGGKYRAGAVYLYKVEADGTTNYLTKLTAVDGKSHDNFGSSISYSDNILTVGSSGFDSPGLDDVGAAYLYQLDSNGSVNFLTKVIAKDRTASDQFGKSVSHSGNLLTVGAYQSDPEGISDAGTAYIYDISQFIDPVFEDRDGDGYSDALETNATTDPDSNQSFPSLDFGLFTHYPMDGNLTVNDISGYDRNGTAQNILLRSDRYGMSGKALGFSDQNQTIFLPEIPLGEYGLSVMGWVRPDSNGGEIFSFGDEGLSGFFLHLETNGSISWGTGHPTHRVYANSPINTWYHLAATYEPGTHLARIYINGILSGSAQLYGGFEPSVYTRLSIPLGSLDLAAGKPVGVTHVVRAESKGLLNQSEGTVSFRVNCGSVGDIFRVWVGDVCVFSAGNAFLGSDHTLFYNDPSGFGFPGNGWRTGGSAASEDDDFFEINFASGQSTTYRIIPGASNDVNGDGISDYNPYDTVSGVYTNIITNNLPVGSVGKALTLQIETNTIGVIYGDGDSANNDADNSGTSGPTFIPRYPQPRTGSGFKGSLDEFRLYSRSLQPAEIMQIKNTESVPSDLNFTAPLTIAENQPVGTIVGEFNATDPDANATLTYLLVSGAGDGNNTLFTLDTNGTLKTSTTFDYESNASSYSIRVQAKDEYNATVEGIFTVMLTDVFEDNDGDGIQDHIDPDDDNDRLSDVLEITYGSDPFDSNSIASGLVIDKWYLDKEWSGISINSTYGAAQVFYEPNDNRAGGRIYVADNYDNKAHVFDSNGTKLFEITGLGWAKGIVVNDNDIIFCLFRNGLKAYDHNGSFLYSLGGGTGNGDGEFTLNTTMYGSEPQGALAIHPNNGRIYAVDGMNNRVQIFDVNGSFYSKFGTAGSSEGQFSDPKDLAFLPDGRLLVTDDAYLNYFDENGTFLKRVSASNARVAVRKDGKLWIGGNLRDMEGNVIRSPIPGGNRATFVSNGDLITVSRKVQYWKRFNYAPSNLNSTVPLTIAENQPIGSIVGEFNATDPDANATLTYHLVSGAGDGNNSFFTLETNGTLKTATTFDYETNASTYAIRVQAKDEFNASVEGNFTVALTNLNEAVTGSVTLIGSPIVGQTLTASNSLTDPEGMGIVSYQWQRNGSPIVLGGDLKSGENGVSGMAGSRNSAVSPDGYHLYVGGYSDGTISWFKRDPHSGNLQFVGKLTQGVNGVDGLTSVAGIDFSPGGEHVYISSGWGGNAISWYDRNASSGALTWQGVIKDDQGGADGLYSAGKLVVSPEGTHVYITAYDDDAVSWYQRNPVSGALTWLGFLKDGVNGVDGLNGAADLLLSKDGKFLYVSAGVDSTVAWFDRNVSTGALAYLGLVRDGASGVDGLGAVTSIASNPSGSTLYASSQHDHSVAWFDRNASTGSLTYVNIIKNGDPGINSLNITSSLETSPDGKHLYCTGGRADGNSSVNLFDINSSTGGLVHRNSYVALKNGDNLLNGIWSFSLSSDGRNLYASSSQHSSIAWFVRDGMLGGLHRGTTGGATHLLSTADQGAAISLQVSYTDGGGYSESLSSSPTTNVNAMYQPSRPPHFASSAANLEMIWVEPGTFTMGSPLGETGRSSNETEHNVTLTKGFYLGKYEVTQAQYEVVMTGDTNGLTATPSNWSNNPNRPVEQVSWVDIQVFLTRLNASEQAAGRLPSGWSYVLPTEAQWEYVCRARTTTAYSWGDTISASDANWNHGNDANQTEDVAQYSANPWGFFDMHGNVWEWTADWYDATNPIGNPVVDPTGAVSGSYRLFRGGSWSYAGTSLRSANRANNLPSDRSPGIGFRVGFKQINQSPTNLTNPAPLTIAENQPIGTVVGEFNATDSDVNATLTYHLVSGAGDGNNSLFTLESNGTLKTATTFDYESNASTYSIRVQAKDEYNATVEGSFTVTIISSNDQSNLQTVVWVDQNSTQSGFTATASAFTPKGFYEISVFYNATHSQISSWAAVSNGISGINLNATIISANLAKSFNGLNSGLGRFFIGEGKNALAINYDVNNDTFQQLIERVNSSSANIEMSYNPSQDTFQFRNKITGSYGIVLNESTSWDSNSSNFGIGNLLEVIHLTAPKIITTNYTLGDHLSYSNGTYVSLGGIGGDPTTYWQTLQDNISQSPSTASSQWSQVVPGVGFGANDQLGQNAIVRINGGSTIYSRSNSFEQQEHGIAGLIFNTTGLGLGEKALFYVGKDQFSIESVNLPPTDIVVVGSTAVLENQPVGTVVGNFRVLDSDQNASYHFSLFDENGTTDNQLFAVESNGTLSTQALLDFESSALRTVQLKASEVIQPLKRIQIDVNSTHTLLANAKRRATVGNYEVTLLESGTFSTLASQNRVPGGLGAGLNLSKKLSELPLQTAITTGTFTIAGKTFSIDSPEVTLQSIVDEINIAVAGVAGVNPEADTTGITFEYDQANDKMIVDGGELSPNSLNAVPVLGSPTDSSNFLHVLRLLNRASVTRDADLEVGSGISVYGTGNNSGTSAWLRLDDEDEILHSTDPRIFASDGSIIYKRVIHDEAIYDSTLNTHYTTGQKVYRHGFVYGMNGGKNLPDATGNGNGHNWDKTITGVGQDARYASKHWKLLKDLTTERIGNGTGNADFTAAVDAGHHGVNLATNATTANGNAIKAGDIVKAQDGEYYRAIEDRTSATAVEWNTYATDHSSGLAAVAAGVDSAKWSNNLPISIYNNGRMFAIKAGFTADEHGGAADPIIYNTGNGWGAANKLVVGNRSVATAKVNYYLPKTSGWNNVGTHTGIADVSGYGNGKVVKAGADFFEAQIDFTAINAIAANVKYTQGTEVKNAGATAYYEAGSNWAAVLDKTTGADPFGRTTAQYIQVGGAAGDFFKPKQDFSGTNFPTYDNTQYYQGTGTPLEVKSGSNYFIRNANNKVADVNNNSSTTITGAQLSTAIAAPTTFFVNTGTVYTRTATLAGIAAHNAGAAYDASSSIYVSGGTNQVFQADSNFKGSFTNSSTLAQNEILKDGGGNWYQINDLSSYGNWDGTNQPYNQNDIVQDVANSSRYYKKTSAGTLNANAGNSAPNADSTNWTLATASDLGTDVNADATTLGSGLWSDVTNTFTNLSNTTGWTAATATTADAGWTDINSKVKNPAVGGLDYWTNETATLGNPATAGNWWTDRTTVIGTPSNDGTYWLNKTSDINYLGVVDGAGGDFAEDYWEKKDLSAPGAGGGDNTYWTEKGFINATNSATAGNYDVNYWQRVMPDMKRYDNTSTQLTSTDYSIWAKAGNVNAVIGDTKFGNHDAAEHPTGSTFNFTAYNAGTAYAGGEYVTGSDNKVYLALATAGTGNDPAAGSVLTNADKWTLVADSVAEARKHVYVDTDYWDQVDVGSDLSTSNYWEKLQETLIQSSQTLGSIDISASLASANFLFPLVADGNGSGNFFIGQGADATRIDYNINTDSISNVIQRVNGSDANVHMYYDPVSDGFYVRNKIAGAGGIILNESLNWDIASGNVGSGNILFAMGLAAPDSALMTITYAPGNHAIYAKGTYVKLNPAGGDPSTYWQSKRYTISEGPTTASNQWRQVIPGIGSTDSSELGKEYSIQINQGPVINGVDSFFDESEHGQAGLELDVCLLEKGTSIGFQVLVDTNSSSVTNYSLVKSFDISIQNMIEDLDGDGTEDHADQDIDGDGFSNDEEIGYGSDPRDPNSIVNTAPTYLKTTTLLTIAENQPMGTIVGEFNATDPDDNATLTYHLVDGNGSTDNSLFTLETNGTLKTAVTFDYESNASTYSIRVQARDEYNGTVEGNFTVTLIDVFDNQAPGAISIQFASLTENQPIGTVVGKLNAVDPESDVVRYALINGFGSSGNKFFTVDLTGVLRTAVVFDFEQNASHSIRGRAMDEFNASREDVLMVQVSNQWEDPDGDGLENSYDPDDDNDGFSDIVEIAYGSDPLDPNSLPNRAPTQISLSSDRVEENMPIGTMVGQLRTIDFDDPNGTGVYQYSFLTNATGAEFFSIDSNGTMLTKQELDFESNSSHTIALRVTDNLGAYLDQNLTIQVVDAFIPIVETGDPVDVGFQEAMLSGKLLDKGSSMDLIQIGMLVSTDPNPNLNTNNIIRETGFLDANDRFEVMIMGLEKGQKYFYRTYAINAEGVGYGVVKDFVAQEHASGPSWANAQTGAAANWWISPWFGSFYMNDGNAWVMHSELGWLYPMGSGKNGVWLWNGQLGWLWTDAQLYPFLYQNTSAGWLYFYGASQDRLLFYHYRDERWIEQGKATGNNQ